MLTLIFDLSGTLFGEEVRGFGPFGSSRIVAYPLTDWIRQNGDRFHLVYATNLERKAALEVLGFLELDHLFDHSHSITKTDGFPPKSTGVPYRHLKDRFPNSLVITDSNADVLGAEIAGLSVVQVIPGESLMAFEQKFRLFAPTHPE